MEKEEDVKTCNMTIHGCYLISVRQKVTGKNAVIIIIIEGRRARTHIHTEIMKMKWS